jgi:hypothetical protein
LILSEIKGIIPEAMFASDVRCNGKASLGSDKESLDQATTAHFVVHKPAFTVRFQFSALASPFFFNKK